MKTTGSLRIVKNPDPELIKSLASEVRVDDQGFIFWHRPSSISVKTGKRVGCVQNGQWVMTYKGNRIYVAQLAWYLVYNEWPDEMVYFFRKDVPTSLYITKAKIKNDHQIQRWAESGVFIGVDGWYAVSSDGTRTNYYLTPREAHEERKQEGKLWNPIG